jgi:RES domain-containing protein
MEMLVHLGNADLLDRYLCIPVSFDDRLCRRIARSDLPADWTADPAPSSTRALGSRWIADASSAVLAVPSSIVHIETIFLLNPGHPDFRKIIIGDPGEFHFDARLKKTRR